MRIGLQLYTMRFEEEKDFPGLLKKIANIGYDGVEFAGYFGYTPAQIREMLEETGLTAAGSHVSLARFEENFDLELSYLKELGMKFVSLPSLPKEAYESKEGLLAVAKRIRPLVQKLNGEGISLSFHNHTQEYETVWDGQKLEDLLTDQVPGLHLEIDTGWCSAAGEDTPARIAEAGELLDLIHVKDVRGRTPVTLGTGDVTVEANIRAAQIAGIEWFIVEQDPPAENPTTFADLEANLAFIRRC